MGLTGGHRARAHHVSRRADSRRIAVCPTQRAEIGHAPVFHRRARAFRPAFRSPPWPVTVTVTPVIAPLPDDVPVVLDAIANKTPNDLLDAIQRTTAAAPQTPKVSDRASRSSLPLERRLMEDLQYAGARNAVTHLKEITMSDRLKGLSMAQDYFEASVRSPATHSHVLSLQPGRSGLPVRLAALLFATMAVGMLACTSEETPTEPAGNPSLVRAAGAYIAVDLGIASGEATGINPAGQVVGSAGTAFLWDKGVVTYLGSIGGGLSSAYAINPAGQVVGDSRTPEGPSHAFLWEKGVMTDLGTLGGCCSVALGINPSGQVVGYSWTAGDVSLHAFLWEKGVMTDLGTRGQSEAGGINPRGQVVGRSTTVTNQLHASLWEKGAWTDLGTLGGALSYAADINPAGQVVGESSTAAGRPHAFLWEKGVMTDLGTLGGSFIYSQANAINSAGQVVGAVWGQQVTRPALWQNGVIIELPTLNGDYDYGRANDINPAGEVVGVSSGRPTLWTRK
jgi:probable HAF family extracellular repeat protein